VIGALHLQVPTLLGYFFVGSVWEGTVLRGIHVVLSAGLTAGTLNLGFAVCGSEVPSYVNFDGGVSLIRSSQVLLSELPFKLAWLRATTVLSAGVYLAVNYPVRGGVGHVICAAQAPALQHAVVSLDVEPERLVRPAMERGRAARAWPSAGSVLDELRLEAIAAAG
jgi:hypothetical protein